MFGIIIGIKKEKIGFPYMPKATNHDIVSIYIVDDELLICESLSFMLESIEGYQVKGYATEGNTALKEIKNFSPDLVIMDVKLKNENGIALTGMIKRRMPEIKIMILSGYCNSNLLSMALAAGAAGYSTKDIKLENLQKSIERILASDKFYLHPDYAHLLEDATACRDLNPISVLTQRELEILLHIVREFTTKEIADKLGISEKTVRNHKSNIMQKLKLKSDASLVKLAYTMALI